MGLTIVKNGIFAVGPDRNCLTGNRDMATDHPQAPQMADDWAPDELVTVQLTKSRRADLKDLAPGQV